MTSSRILIRRAVFIWILFFVFKTLDRNLSFIRVCDDSFFSVKIAYFVEAKRDKQSTRELRKQIKKWITFEGAEQFFSRKN